MDLARHSDINLTMGYYSHTLVSDRAEALEALPDLTDAPEQQQQAATGTYDSVPLHVDMRGKKGKHNDKRARATIYPRADHRAVRADSAAYTRCCN